MPDALTKAKIFPLDPATLLFFRRNLSFYCLMKFRSDSFICIKDKNPRICCFAYGESLLSAIVPGKRSMVDLDKRSF